MLASEDKKPPMRLKPMSTDYTYPSQLPVSSSSKTLNTPKRPAKEVIGQIHRRLSSSNFDSPNGRTSSIPLRVPNASFSGTSANSSGPNSANSSFSGIATSGTYSSNSTGTNTVQRAHRPRPLQIQERRLSYTTGQEPFVNQKSIRKSVIYPSSPHDPSGNGPPPPHHLASISASASVSALSALASSQSQSQSQSHTIQPQPPKRHYQYHQAPSSPIAVAPARPLSFSRPRSARASISPPAEHSLELIPPVPPLPEQVVIGKHRQVRQHSQRSVSNDLPSRHQQQQQQQQPPHNPQSSSNRRGSHQSMDMTGTMRNSYNRHSSGLLKMPKSQTTTNLSFAFAFKEQSNKPNSNTSGNQKQSLHPAPNNTTTNSTNAANKSPFRPLNRPALLHPHSNQYSSSSPESSSPAAGGSGPSSAINNLTANASKIAAMAGLDPPPLATDPITTASSTTNSSSSSVAKVRSKSTAPKQWISTPRSGQSSAAATRRMLFSPFKKRSEKVGSATAAQAAAPGYTNSTNGIAAAAAAAAPFSRSPESEFEISSSSSVEDLSSVLNKDQEREIRDLMRRLVTSKPDDSSIRKRMDEYRRTGQQPQPSMTPAVATKNYRLNLYEKGEILDFRKVYFCGKLEAKKISGDIRRATGNYGFDDDKGDYKVVVGDHIAYRYEILGVLGKGSFGKVIKCIDHKTGKLVAVKMIINRKRFHMQALVEADILKTLSAWNSKDKYHLVRYTEHFNFRDHLCISTELLGINLYELIKYNQYKGLSPTLVKHFTRQMLEALRFLDAKTVIHCDLKPENVLLSDPERGLVKIIDFGSSCYESERVYTYIQSRFYRSPEVMLGMSYSQQIDVWSLGCIVAELLTGRPLFMGENEQEQISCIMEIFGVPEKAMISKCARRKLFFDSMGNPRMKTKEKRTPNSRTLQGELKTKDAVLVDFVSRFLEWNPKKRITSSQALKHEWITGQTPPMSHTPTPPLQMAPTPPPHTVGMMSHSSSSNSLAGGSGTYGFKASPRQMQQRATPAGRRERGWR